MVGCVGFGYVILRDYGCDGVGVCEYVCKRELDVRFFKGRCLLVRRGFLFCDILVRGGV